MNASLITDSASPISIAVSGSDLFVGYNYGGVAGYTTSGAAVNLSLLPGANCLGHCGIWLGSFYREQ